MERICSWVLLTGKNKGRNCQAWTNHKYCPKHIEKGLELDAIADREAERVFVMQHGITRAQHAAEQAAIAEAARKAKADADEKEFIEKHGMGPKEFKEKQRADALAVDKELEQKALDAKKLKYSDPAYCIREFEKLLRNYSFDDYFDNEIVKYDEDEGIFTVGEDKYIIKVVKL